MHDCGFVLRISCDPIVYIIVENNTVVRIEIEMKIHIHGLNSILDSCIFDILNELLYNTIKLSSLYTMYQDGKMMYSI